MPEVEKSPVEYRVARVAEHVGAVNNWFVGLPLASVPAFALLPGALAWTALVPLLGGLAPLAGRGIDALLWQRIRRKNRSREVASFVDTLQLPEFDPSAPHVTPVMRERLEDLLASVETFREAVAAGRAHLYEKALERARHELVELQLLWNGRVDTGIWAARDMDSHDWERWERSTPEPLFTVEGRGATRLPFPEGLVDMMLLEFVPGEPGLQGRVALSRKSDGKSKPDQEWAVSGPPFRATLLPPIGFTLTGVLTREGHLHVDFPGPWTLRLLGLGEAPRFANTAEGEGDEVLVYTGPPALLRIEGAEADGLGGYLSSSGRFRLREGEEVLVNDRVPFAVRATGPWKITAEHTDAPVRSFDGEIEGVGNAVVHYTGPTRLLVISSDLPGARFGDPALRLDLLTANLTPDTAVFCLPTPNYPPNPRITFLARHGSTFHVIAPGHQWSFTPEPEGGTGSPTQRPRGSTTRVT